MAFLGGLLLVLFILTAVLLVIIVLLQDEQGEGFGGIFGGGGNAAPVGNRSGNILTRATSIIATVFLLSLFGYAWINRTPENSNVEAAARALEAESEGVLEWWLVDEDSLGQTDGETTEGEAPALESAAPAEESAEGDETEN